MPIESASSLRDQLERRRVKNQTSGLLRLPFVLDPDLAEEAEALAKQVAALDEKLDLLAEESVVAGEDDPDADVRASGVDLSPASVEMAEVESEIARVKVDLAAKVDEANRARVWLLFRRATADEYEQLLRKHGGSIVAAGSDDERRFLDALTARCYVGAEMPDGSRDSMTWPEFVDAAQLSMGELGPIRSMVFAENARGGNSVPFSSASSRRMRNS